MIEVARFRPFPGVHCETVATGSLLWHAGVRLSEPMLFGLGEGLGFVMLNLRDLPLPFVGGRTKPFDLTRTLCSRLGVACTERQTSSAARAWQALQASLEVGVPVGLQLDCYYLEYFSQPVHFAGHAVAAYGLDGDDVLLVDTSPQGGRVRAGRRGVEQARLAKGPMAARARSWTVSAAPGDAGVAAGVPLRRAVLAALRGNAAAYCAPSFAGAGARGVETLAASLPGWLRRSPEPAALCQVASLMERAGTGGGLFRRFYAEFLAEALDLLPEHAGVLAPAQEAMADAAQGWTAVAALLDRAGRAADERPLLEAASTCRGIAGRERAAMTALAALPQE